jgi:hypothetical protein
MMWHTRVKDVETYVFWHIMCLRAWLADNCARFWRRERPLSLVSGHRTVLSVAEHNLHIAHLYPSSAAIANLRSWQQMASELLSVQHLFDPPRFRRKPIVTRRRLTDMQQLHIQL